MERFTIEEINLLCIYNTETRAALLSDLHLVLPDIFDPELREIVITATRKLEVMTDAEYIEIAPGLVPADEYTDEGD